jgi:hypothetical protein
VFSIGPGVDEIDTASTADVVPKLNARKDVLSKDLDTIDDISGTIGDIPNRWSGILCPLSRRRDSRRSFVSFPCYDIHPCRLGRGDSPFFAPD